MISHTGQGVRFATRALGSAPGDIIHETWGALCCGRCVLHLVIWPTKQRAYDLLRALGSAPFHITHKTRGTICYGHWVLHLVISPRKQGERFVRGIGFCIM